MARKRMLNIEIIDSDLFLEMPQSTQNLYFHLCMRADDDGFIDNYKKILRMIGANIDDLKLLITKQYIIPFDSGVVVIKHWRIHNTLSANRYKETQYKTEKNLLMLDENNAYNLNEGMVIDDSHLIEISKRQTKDKQKTNTDKNRIDKNSIYNNIYIYGQNEGQKLGQLGQNDEIYLGQFKIFYEKYPKKVKKQDVLKWFEKNRPSNELFSSMMNRLEQFRASKEWQKDGGQFIPYPTTWLNQKRWEDEAIDDSQVKKEKGFEQRNYENLDFLYANQEGRTNER